ncbi:uncharacterized protein LOC123563178 isoform X1 [Mercenaria mercenaria]|uniref:uncharacterized protein LOC123563178 isoform X1 n=1 Tax=Mercenaria mercenaria TaxID=6596 RepID=UPI00234F78BE|nr:uncharacterized protein LOC123563178 isoform X1 [Mercenaria mercenaria]
MQQKKIYSLYIKYRHLCYMFLEFTLNGMEFLRGKKRTLSPDPPEEPLRKVIRRGSVQESARGNAINRQRKRGIDRHDGARGGTRGRKMPKQNGTRRHGRARRTRVDRLNNSCLGILGRFSDTVRPIHDGSGRFSDTVRPIHDGSVRAIRRPRDALVPSGASGEGQEFDTYNGGTIIKFNMSM